MVRRNKHKATVGKTGTSMSESFIRPTAISLINLEQPNTMRRSEKTVKQVELRQIELTTPDIDFIQMWLESKKDPGVNQYIEHLMHEIVDKYERAEVKEIL